MFKVITKKEDMILEPKLEMNHEQIISSQTDDIVLYGKKFKMYSDEWKHHLHIKCTDVCDASCKFCIEKSARNNRQNPKAVLESAKEVLDQLQEQGMLRTVSITGGEPTMFPYIGELIDLIQSYPVTLFSINTNGRYLEKIPNNFKGAIDLSKHKLDDSEVFGRNFRVNQVMIKEFKDTHPNATVRVQCVLGQGIFGVGLTKEEVIGYYVKTFMGLLKDYVDDFSFRELIIESQYMKRSKSFGDLRRYLIEYGEFVEQVIQDYYVYETYRLKDIGKPITISWSNMYELKSYNEGHEDEGFLEEIIVHPDGMVAGSWNKKSLILKEGSKDGFFIPCKGIGCKKHCLRYQGEVMYEIPMLSGCGGEIDTCGNGWAVPSCVGSVPSC